MGDVLLKRIKTKINIKWISIILILIVGFLAVTLTHFDAPIYQKTIARVETVHNYGRTAQSDEFNNHDYSENQDLTLKILNGMDAGKTVQASNQFSGSNATDTQYHKGQQIH